MRSTSFFPLRDRIVLFSFFFPGNIPVTCFFDIIFQFLSHHDGKKKESHSAVAE